MYLFNGIKKKLIIILLLLLISAIVSDAKMPFTFDDAMKFKDLRQPKISEEGNWISFTSNPDRGDGECIIQSTIDSSKTIVPRGTGNVFSKDSKWSAMFVLPKALETANAKSPADAPKNGIALVRLGSGRIYDIPNVKKFEFSNDAQWLVYHKNPNKDDKSEKFKKKTIGSELVLRHLFSATEIKIDYVTEYLLDSISRHLIYTISTPDGHKDGIYLRKLFETFAPELPLNTNENTLFSCPAWNNSDKVLAYIQASLRKDGRPDNGSLMLWEEKKPEVTQYAVSEKSNPIGMYIPSDNHLKWTEDGKKLFFGFKPLFEKDTADIEDIKFTDSTYYNKDSILKNSDEIIWHWNDPRIASNNANWWKANKNRTYTAIYDYIYRKYVQIADTVVSKVVYSDNSNFTVGYNENRYMKLLTYDDSYFDLYLCNLETGIKKLLAEKLLEPAELSPQGKYILYFQNKNWIMYDIKKDSTYNLTNDLKVAFYDVENDVPQIPKSYGIGGWFTDDKSVYLNEQYDVYRFFTEMPGSFFNASATVGRRTKTEFRVINLEPDKKVFKENDTLYMHGFSDTYKCNNIFFFETRIAGGINMNTVQGNGFKEEKNYFAVGLCKKTKRVLYTSESFSEFPNLWLADCMFDTVKKLTNVNPDINDFKWGTTELVKWISPMKDSLYGYIIKPDNFDANKKYPLLVYFYEKFSNQAFRFYQPRINHRPVYQSYLSDGYMIFIPDIVYKNGRPGLDAKECITSGVNSLLARGFIDKDKMCIQGHSWGAYQTAFVITQTDMFKAAAAGAPVANMTSAYSEIRTESGMARQFQYEKSQSRIGGNLWDSLTSFLNNSPVFLTPKVKTPLLILQGDVDEAVPFSQGVELYLAYRRLDKNCVLVEYKNEPHHPRKYENKLDWQIRMKEWFDFYLLGKPAPKWITDGEPYKGD
jgi:dipeptidyl aminopeptidase/acylaminoacyl peptidase